MLLEQHLSALGIPFWTESDMRAHGYFKTPDIWLQVTLGGGGGGGTWASFKTPIYSCRSVPLGRKGEGGGGGCMGLLQGDCHLAADILDWDPCGPFEGCLHSFHTNP